MFGLVLFSAALRSSALARWYCWCYFRNNFNLSGTKMLQSSSRDNFGNFFFLLSCMFTPFISCLERKLVQKKKEKHTHMTREHMEKGEKKVDKTEDKRVVHSFTFSLSFSYNRFFLSITVYIKIVRPLEWPHLNGWA